MNASEKYIHNVVVNDARSLPCGAYSPSQYGDMQRQYLDERTRRFISKRAYLASDYVAARVQGINGDFYAWTDTYIRLSEVSTNNRTAFDAKKADDWKEILFPELCVDYFPIGAKVETMGSTWICINPYNISSPNASAIIVRCNASYNSYDDYGNVVTEPICVEKQSMMLNNNDRNENIVNVAGYYNITAQLNATTQKLGQNMRLVIGNKPYHITGFTDFIQEFTGDRESAHCLSFTARIDEPNDLDDVSVNYIANGNAYNYSAEISCADEVIVGYATPRVEASFLLNGDIVPSTPETPLNWAFSSSDENVLTVDENGDLAALAQGTATITATLVQNPAITASKVVQTYENTGNVYVAFVGVPDKALRQYQSATYTVACYSATGQIMPYHFEWAFSGANAGDYTATVSADTQSVTITCLSASSAPLTITASCVEETGTATVAVELEGY